MTNKSRHFAAPLLARLKLGGACLICGDTVQNPKPHPEPLLHAAQLVQEPARRCAYVGDSLRDIEAAKAANMRSLAVGYGYEAQHSAPADWGADAVLEQLDELADWLAKTA